jgi:hypothetical protein
VQVRGWHVTNAVTLARGRHTVKVGGDVRRHDVSYRTGALTAGSYLFEDVESLNRGGLPLGTAQTFFESFVSSGDETAHVTPGSQDYSAFIQDTIRVGDRLTVDAGLRYERQVIESGPPLSDALDGFDAAVATTPGADTNDWAPRLGVAWSLSRRVVAHVSYGVTFGSTPLGLVAAAQLHGSGALAPHTFGSGDSPRPGFPTAFDSAPPGNLPIVVVFDRAFERPRVHGGSAGLEWQWMPQTSLTLTYLHATGRHLPRAVERNVGAPVPLVFSDAVTGESLPAWRFSPGPFGGVSRLVAIESTGESTYNGLSVELRRDLSQGIHYRLAFHCTIKTRLIGC